MPDFSSTREIAELCGTDTWRVRRLFEDGTLDEPPRFAGKRAIPRSQLVEIIDALRARGWLPTASEHPVTGPSDGTRTGAGQETEDSNDFWETIGEMRHRITDLERWADLVSHEMARNDLRFSVTNEERRVLVDVTKFLTTGATLTEADLPQATQTLTIKAVDQRSLGQGPNADVKVCVEFSELKKVLGLNKTNLKRLIENPLNLGGDSSGWINKQVQVYRTWTQFKDETVKCVRVWAPNQQPPEPIIDGNGNPAGLNPVGVQHASQEPVAGSPIPRQPTSAQQPAVQPPVPAPQQPSVQQPPAPQQDGQVTPPEATW